MRVAVDLDMTLNNMAYTWMSWINKNIDSSMTVENVAYYGFLRDAYGKFADTYWKDPKAYDSILPLDGAKEFLKALPNVFILTHTPTGQRQDIKEAWVKKHFGDIEVIHSDHKHHHTKDCILIDDHPGHVQRHVRHNLGTYGIVFNHENRYGWSKPLLSHTPILVATNYGRILEILL